MQNGTIRYLLVILLVITVAAVADDELPVPADEFVYCTVCHGVQLMGNPIIKAPRLSGMESWYVENQLLAYKKGWRGQHENDVIGVDMRQTVTALTEEQIREVAAFVAATRSEPPTETIAGNAEDGKRLYSSCGTCHGVRAEGNIALGSPALTGLNDWYLVKQIRDFKDGTRGSQPGDTYGMQMRASVGLLPDDQAIHDVVKYISTLGHQ
jgi:cytochrome c oxidase subunit 2